MVDDTIKGNIGMNLLDAFASYLPDGKRLETKAIVNSYAASLSESKRAVVDDLYGLMRELHPTFLYTEGAGGTMDGIAWLTEAKNVDRFMNYRGSNIDSGGNGRRTGITTASDIAEESNDEPLQSEADFFQSYMERLDHLSGTFASTLFGSYVNDMFESELPYSIAESAFRNMGFKTAVSRDEQDRARVEIDLSKLKLETFAYTFVPWTSSIGRESGRVLNEGLNDGEGGRKYYVDIGLKPEVFNHLPTAVTTPVHEIVHHISSHYTSNAYQSAVQKAFRKSFKDFGGLKIVSDHGMLFGQVDKGISDELDKAGVELRGSDLLDPFVLWEIVKRNGDCIADLTGKGVEDLQSATFGYMSSYLPFRIMEEGIASNLSIYNSGVDRMPAKLKGLDKSVKGLVRFGVDMRKFEYLSRGMSFYTGERLFAGYPIPEEQVYPLSYLQVRNLFEDPSTDAKDYFDLVRDVYTKGKIIEVKKVGGKAKSPDFKDIQKEIRSILLRSDSREGLRQYYTEQESRAQRPSAVPGAMENAEQGQLHPRQNAQPASVYERRNPRIGRTPSYASEEGIIITTSNNPDFLIESLIYDVGSIFGYNWRRRPASARDQLIWLGIHCSLRLLLENL